MLVFSSQVCCLQRHCGAGNARHGTGSVCSGAADAVCVGCSQLHASECPAPARVSLVCLCIRANFVRPADRVIEHKALFVCASGLSFSYFCCRGAMVFRSNKRHPVSSQPLIGFCMHARAHTVKTRRHFCTHACLLAILPAATTCCCCLPYLLPLLALRKPGPRSLGFGGHLGRDPDQSDSGRVSRSLEHESASFHTWHKPLVQRPGCLVG